MRYRRRFTEVDAIWIKEDQDLVPPDVPLPDPLPSDLRGKEWKPGRVWSWLMERTDGFSVAWGKPSRVTLNTGTRTEFAEVGDWLVQEGDEFYAMKPDVFYDRYERVLE